MNTVVLLEMVFEGGYAFGLVLISCELGEQTTNAFGGIGNEMRQYDWYLYPLELQRLYSSLLVISQRPVHLECFGSYACLRDSFKKVISLFSWKWTQHFNGINSIFRLWIVDFHILWFFVTFINKFQSEKIYGHTFLTRIRGKWKFSFQSACSFSWWHFVWRIFNHSANRFTLPMIDVFNKRQINSEWCNANNRI